MNLAQQFYYAILGDELLLKLHSRGKNFSFTKTGPGRKHKQGKYIGIKYVYAEPMTRKEYNDLRGWPVPADENGDDPGYLVEYIDGGKSNALGYNGYVSWSPADVFERAYQELA